MTSEDKVIGISPANPAAKKLWAKVLELAESFGAEERWSLIGGLMVQTLGKYTTFQVPGGSQALSRTEVVRVSLDGNPPVELRHPSLLGAILIKARAVAARRDRFDSDRKDLVRLLSFVHDPRALAGEERLRTTEKRSLRDIEQLMAFDDAALADAFRVGDVGRAGQAYRLLIA